MSQDLKQRGFSLIELLIVVAVILIVAAIAIPNYLQARRNAGEAGGSATIRSLVTVSITYSTTYPQAGFPQDIGVLGDGGVIPCVASSTSACLTDIPLGCAAQPCLRDNYLYSITGISASGNPPNADFVAFGTPVAPNQGAKDFCATSDAVVRYQVSLTPPTAAIVAAAPCEALPPIPR